MGARRYKCAVVTSALLCSSERARARVILAAGKRLLTLGLLLTLGFMTLLLSPLPQHGALALFRP